MAYPPSTAVAKPGNSEDLVGRCLRMGACSTRGGRCGDKRRPPGSRGRTCAMLCSYRAVVLIGERPGCSHSVTVEVSGELHRDEAVTWKGGAQFERQIIE